LTRWPEFLFQGLYADRQIRKQALYHVARDEKRVQLTKTLFIIKSDGRKKQDHEQQYRRERLNCMQKTHIAHSVFATVCEFNCPDIASARRSSCPITRSPGFVPIVANAHALHIIIYDHTG
jgi:hypothetical protein